METIKGRRDYNIGNQVMRIESDINFKYVSIPEQKSSKYRDEVEEFKYQLAPVEAGERSEFFESITF